MKNTSKAVPSKKTHQPKIKKELYCVLSISELKNIMKEAKAESRLVYDGEIKGESCTVLKFVLSGFEFPGQLRTVKRY
jgi:hypothetical protein